jgi:hypothetical protein
LFLVFGRARGVPAHWFDDCCSFVCWLAAKLFFFSPCSAAMDSIGFTVLPLPQP